MSGVVQRFRDTFGYFEPKHLVVTAHVHAGSHHNWQAGPQPKILLSLQVHRRIKSGQTWHAKQFDSR